MLENSRSTEVITDALPHKNPMKLLINEAFPGLRHKDIDADPSQVVGEEEILNDLPSSNNKELCF